MHVVFFGKAVNEGKGKSIQNSSKYSTTCQKTRKLRKQRVFLSSKLTFSSQSGQYFALTLSKCLFRFWKSSSHIFLKAMSSFSSTASAIPMKEKATMSSRVGSEPKKNCKGGGKESQYRSRSERIEVRKKLKAFFPLFNSSASLPDSARKFFSLKHNRKVCWNICDWFFFP